MNLRVWHRRLSYAALVPWAWFVLTGSALWFMHAKRDSTPPYASAEAPLPLEDQFKVAMGLGPEHVKRIDFARPGLNLRVVDDLDRATFFSNSEKPFVNLGAQSEVFDEWIVRLHRGRFAGLPGQIVFSLLALFLCAFIVSGILISAKSPRRVRKWHRTVGWISALPLLIVYLTGSLWNLSAQLRLQSVEAKPHELRMVDWTSAFDRANEILPELRSLHRLPGAILAEGRDGSRVYFQTGGTMQIFKAWTLRGWLEPLFQIHSGRILGWPGRILIFLTWAGGLVLVVTGVTLQRAKSRRTSR